MPRSANVKTMGIAGSIALSFLLWYVPNKSLLTRFMPRSKCMFYEGNLIFLHAISDITIFISYMVLTLSLFKVFKLIEKKNIPLKGFVWMFGIFIFFCGLTHAMGVLDLYISYYWLDGVIKFLCAIFSVYTMVTFARVPSILQDMYTGEEYRELHRKNEELEQRIIRLEKGTN